MRSRLKNLVLTISMGLTLLVASPVCGQELQFQHYSTDEGFTGGSFKRMTQDSLGFLWIMTSTGIYRFDGYNFDRLYDIQGFGISAIDPQGGAWFGCSGKLLSFIHAREDFDSVKLPATGMPTALAFSSDAKVWIGTNHEGLLCFGTYRHGGSSFHGHDMCGFEQRARRTGR